VLGPILFLRYTADLQRVVEQHRLLTHLYANDTQIYGACSPSTTTEFQNRVSSCVEDVATWMQSNRLQLKSAKMEVLWCASNRWQLQIPQSSTRIGADDVMPSAFVRDLVLCIDADVSMRTHVVKTVSSCFAILRHLRSIRRSVSKPVMQSLVVVLVLTRLDYGNVTLAGLANLLLVKLQSVLNAAARLIFVSRKFDHVTPLLREFHWRSFPERINCKLALLVFKCLNGLAPPYLACEFRRVADREASAAALGVDSGPHNTTSPSRNHRWSIFPSCGCKVWKSTIKCDIIVKFESFQVSLEN